MVDLYVACFAKFSSDNKDSGNIELVELIQ